MKTCMAVTVERGLFKKIEQLRGREKRSTFVEHILELGIDEYQKRTVGKYEQSIEVAQRAHP